MIHLSDHFVVTVGDRGRLVLPAELRRQLHLASGDRLIVTIDPAGGFRAISAREQAQRLLGMFSYLAPGRSLVDELIADRRAEAQAEDAE